MYDIPAFDEGIPLNPGDRLILEPLPSYKGYYGSCCRIFNIGPLRDDVLKRAELVDVIQEKAIAAVKPGITTGDLWTAMNEGFQEVGEEYVFDQGGHGVGLNIHEPPMIARGEDLLVEEGMVLAVETWTIGKASEEMEFGEVYGIEDYVVVTKNGGDVFPGYPKNQRVLGG